MNKFLILFPTTSLGLVTSGCGLFNHDLLFGLDFAKSLPISNSYSKSPSPVLQYLTEHKDNSQLKFTTPQYQDDNQVVFDWLATRVVSVILVSYDYSKHDYQLSFGTATILGAADQQTKAGKDLAFYLASNYHVFAGLEHKYSQSKRQKPVGFYFGFNHYFQKLIQDKKHPSQQDLQSKSDDLFLTKPDYYPITFDPLFGVYFANNVSVYGVNNLAQKQSSFNNLKFAADFAVIKVNFSSALHSSVGSRFLRKTSGRKQAINHYVKQLKNNITEYGDLTFSSKDLKSGYMMSYPYVDSPKKEQNLTISVNLELKNLPVPTMKMVINNDLDWKIGNNWYKQPFVEYQVDKLNILPGSSGSPLIEYQADQKKFVMNGIYWGTTSFSGIDLKNLDYSYGMITKLIATGKYDLISNTDSNTPHDNNLCSYLTTHNPTFKSDFC